MLDELRNTGDRCCDDGESACHRFHQDVRNPVTVTVLRDLTWKGKDVGALVESHDCFERLLSHQHDELFEMQLLNQGFHVGLQGTESNDAAVKPISTNVEQVAG